jgi:serine/threonine-protein kinase RsbW
MKTDFELQVRSDPRLLSAVRAMISGYMRQNGFNQDRTNEIVLAVDEACANAIRHSYEGQPDRFLSLVLRTNDTGIELELHDDGWPAPPEKTRKRELAPPSPDRLVPGGLGVQLMHQVFDEVSFTPGEKTGNCVVMRLNKPPVEG